AAVVAGGGGHGDRRTGGEALAGRRRGQRHGRRRVAGPHAERERARGGAPHGAAGIGAARLGRVAGRRDGPCRPPCRRGGVGRAAVYGEGVWVPTMLPSTRTSRRCTLTLSVAVAARVIEAPAAKLWPAVGLVWLTTGAVLPPPPPTVKVTVLEVVLAPP